MRRSRSKFRVVRACDVVLIGVVRLHFMYKYPQLLRCMIDTDSEYSASAIFVAALFVHCNFRLTSWLALRFCIVAIRSLLIIDYQGLFLGNCRSLRRLVVRSSRSHALQWRRLACDF